MHDDRVATLARGCGPATVRASHPRRVIVGLLSGGLAALLTRFAGEARRRRRKRKKRRHKDKKPQPPKPRPSEELDAHCPVASGASQGVRIPAVTFVPRRSGFLTRVWVLLMDSQAGQDFSLLITPVDAEGKPTEELLAGAEVLDVPEAGHGHPAQPLAVTFADPALVLQGTRYALIVTSGYGFQLALGQTDQCPDSRAFDMNQDGVFTEIPDRDFAFETFVFG
jgi:hypothetical protein